jgi:hypothetical protein
VLGDQTQAPRPHHAQTLGLKTRLQGSQTPTSLGAAVYAQVAAGRAAVTPSTSNLWGLLGGGLGAGGAPPVGSFGGFDEPATLAAFQQPAEGAPAPARAAAAPAAPAGEGADEGRADKGKVRRMRKLLTDAEVQLGVAKATIIEREAEIARLRGAASSRRLGPEPPRRS